MNQRFLNPALTLVSVVPLLAGATPIFGAEDAGGHAKSDPKAIVKLVQTHCVRCHGGEKTKAGVDLAGFESDLHVWQARGKWTKVLNKLREEEMPPEDEPPLAASDRSRLIDWIAHTLDNVDVDRIPRDPGSVPPRRLNRNEYDYTLRDIFGMDLVSARLLPADQVFGDGFDNEAVALTVEERWLEKALAAADETVLEVWKDPEALSKLLFVRPSPPPEKAVYVSSPEEAELCDMSRDFTVVARFRGTTPSTILLKAPPGKGLEEGARQLRYSHFSLVYSIGPKREFRASGVDVVDGREHIAALKLEDGRATWLLDGQLVDRSEEFSAPDSDKHVLKIGWVPAFSRRKPEKFAELSFFASALPDDQLIAMTNGEQVSKLPESAFHWRPGVKKKDGPVSAESAAERVLQRYLRRAFRRSPTAEEMTRYMGLYRQATKAGLPFEIAMQWPVKAALVSPAFLLRSEVKSDRSGPYPVSSVEMASRLSYFLWCSAPDEELLAAAAEGTLAEPDGLLAQLERMIADEKSERFIERFALQWLRIEGLGDTYTPDADRFPDVSSSLLAAMKRESVLSIGHVIRNNRSLLELLDHDSTFVDAELAKHYGFPDLPEAGWVQVSLDDKNRGGLLTQASVLTVSSSPRRTSPVFRGKWILDVLLGEPPPPPPANVPELPAEVESGAATLRELLEIHRKEAACAGCHNRIDPLGLALEQFDAVGRLRKDDRDTSTTLDGDAIDGVADLKRILLTKKRGSYVRHITGKMLTYAIGRDLILADERTLQAIISRLEGDGYRAGTLIREIVLSEPFRYRMSPADKASRSGGSP